mmetsp:Transcript_103530/g.221396  ORF Transcript_103530/g.221396 Transcript_103530/m.221396 type:complete len:277 (-) Transcript_103530:4-834(-)
MLDESFQRIEGAVDDHLVLRPRALYDETDGAPLDEAGTGLAACAQHTTQDGHDPIADAQVTVEDPCWCNKHIFWLPPGLEEEGDAPRPDEATLPAQAVAPVAIDVAIDGRQHRAPTALLPLHRPVDKLEHFTVHPLIRGRWKPPLVPKGKRHGRQGVGEAHDIWIRLLLPRQLQLLARSQGDGPVVLAPALPQLVLHKHLLHALRSLRIRNLHQLRRLDQLAAALLAACGGDRAHREGDGDGCVRPAAALPTHHRPSGHICPAHPWHTGSWSQTST